MALKSTSIAILELITATSGIVVKAMRFSFLWFTSNIGQYFTLVGEILVDKKSRLLKRAAFFSSQEDSL